MAMASTGLAFKGIWARLAYAEGTDVLGVLFYRALMTAPLLAIVGAVLRWRARAKQPPANRPRTQGGVQGDLQAIGLGVVFCGCMVTDFQAIAYLGAGLSRVILFGFPLIVMALEAGIRRHLPTPIQVRAFVFAWVGMAMVAAPPSGGYTTDTWRGMAWAASAVLIYGCYTWASASVSRRVGSVRFTITSNLTTSVCLVTCGFVVEGAHAPYASSTAMMWLMLMAVVSTVIPYFLMFEGMARAGATQASLVSMLGPAITMLASVLLLGEAYTWLQVIGAVVVVFSIASLHGFALPRRWSKAQPPGLASLEPTEQPSDVAR